MNTPTPAADIRERLRSLAHELEHILPAQAPIRDFVHHNTLHGFQHLPFHQGLAAMRALTGIRPWLIESDNRRLHAAGRIDEGDLRAAIASVFPDAAEARREHLLAALRHPVEALTPAQLDWEIAENAGLEKLRPTVPIAARHKLLADRDEAVVLAGLWQACRDHAPGAADESASLDTLGAERTAALWQRLGTGSTWRELLHALTGEDLLDYIRPLLVRQFSAQLDLGLAAWHNPQRARGLYAAWKACTLDDPERTGEGRELRALAVGLPDDSLDAVIALLQRSELEEERWEGYLKRLALHLPGWAGMVLWREQHPDWRGGAGVEPAPVAILDYLAVFLAYERFAAGRIIVRHWDIKPTFRILRWYFDLHPAEALVRSERFAGALDEDEADLARGLIGDARAAEEERLPEWTAIAERIVAARAEHRLAEHPARQAWPLFVLAQHLGIDAAALPAQADALNAALHELDADTRGRLWLLGYERHYRQQVLATLAANRARKRRAAGPAPAAQLVFCMDEREEGTRRHLEEVAPDVATFGAAGFFGVAMAWTGLDDAVPQPLCPVVVKPNHAVREIAAAGYEAAAARHAVRRTRRLGWKHRLFQDSRQGGLRDLVATLLVAPVSLAVLAGKVLAPGRIGRSAGALVKAHDGEVRTRAAFDATFIALTHRGPDALPGTESGGGALLAGFTDVEQADRVQAFLRMIGLVDKFAPLVVIVGHGSHSLNNPHRSAYDCGACGGKHGGPNARVFAAMANRDAVRTLLAARGLAIPQSTRFVGCQHDTCDDTFTFFEREQLDAAARAHLDRLERQLAEAGRRHAVERCRRFASAPADVDPRRAQRHASARGDDFAQARPELGHVTNAAAVIGRRSMTRGAYFDRRSFLISYDPTIDADGRILEGILLAAGPVGAGISLEYYFSTVNNAGLGCSSKVTHNLAGLVGVMEGTQSDLRTGLPRQMIEIHEPMRLLIVCESTPALLDAIVGRQPALRELVGNGWVQVVAQEPDSGALHVLEPGRGWQAWRPDPNQPLPPLVASSRAWFAGQMEHLAPALLEAGA